jgi:hypothetical protein
MTRAYALPNHALTGPSPERSLAVAFLHHVILDAQGHGPRLVRVAGLEKC